jgi:hypothetical protein
MLANSGKSASAVTLLAPVDAADTTAATGTAVDIRPYEGDLMVTSSVGVVTAGSIAGKLQACSDAGGTGAEDITGATFTTVTTANDPLVQKITVSSDGLPAAKPFLRYIGTVTTGPSAVSVVMHARPKYID